MNEAIQEMKKSHSRMTTALNELEALEDGVDVDYTGCVIAYKKIVNILERRRETLQGRGRTQ